MLCLALLPVEQAWVVKQQTKVWRLASSSGINVGANIEDKVFPNVY